jgi:ABC-2 type transport system ATP-binding protein
VSTPAIDLVGVAKSYGRTPAVEDLSLTVGRGELVGLLGPNGAGKTTTIKLLLGLVRPSAGSGQVLGAPLGDRKARAAIGYLPEQFRYQPWLHAREVLRLHAELARIPAARRAAAIDDALALVGLVDRADDPVSDFSKGMQQRLGLGVALLGDPDLVLLDEPTSALDPVGRTDVRAIVRAARDRGATVILNSHLLSEIEVTFYRVAFIRNGEVVRILDISSLENNQSLVTIRADGWNPDVISGMDQWGRDIHAEDGEVTLTVQDEARIPELNRYLVQQGVNVFAITPVRKSLEEIFIETVGEDGGL